MKHASILLAACAALSGCMTEDVMRYDGVTLQAGDAIAANTAMQMVDPWPVGVEETHLLVPADRGDEGTAEKPGGNRPAGVAAGGLR